MTAQELRNQFLKETKRTALTTWETMEYARWLESQLKGFNFCPHCGDKLEYTISTDVSTDKVCKSVLCKKTKT